MKYVKVVCVIIAYVFAFVNLFIITPEKEFYVDNTEDSLIHAVKDYIGDDPEIAIEPEFVLSTTVGKQIVVIFQDSNYENFMGAVIFQRGLNGLYRPINMEYGMDCAVRHISTRSLLTDPKSHTIFYSAHLPEEVNSIEILKHSMFNSQEEYMSKYVTRVEVNDNPFVYIHPKSGFRDFRLLDANDKVIPQDQYSEKNPAYTTCNVTTVICDLPVILVILSVILLLFIPCFFLDKEIKKRNTSII